MMETPATEIAETLDFADADDQSDLPENLLIIPDSQ